MTAIFSSRAPRAIRGVKIARVASFSRARATASGPPRVDSITPMLPFAKVSKDEWREQQRSNCFNPELHEARPLPLAGRAGISLALKALFFAALRAAIK